MPVGTDELLAELNILMEEALPPPEDLHELHFRILELMGELEATGEPIPDDITRFERELREQVERVRAERDPTAKHGKRLGSHRADSEEHRRDEHPSAADTASSDRSDDSRHSKAK